jgi:hypothetical protein
MLGKAGVAFVICERLDVFEHWLVQRAIQFNQFPCNLIIA